ncbi:riboflavin synthase alpha chain [Salmonella enterica subsp. arizonae]|uniref:Riboflavin synthase alpha chain n=1 Tax=Salmonella enterica subsp. arizonae TaxID=59203 RepID=A0A379SI27_SALER|nr:riboflavin synthase alpha chain [Salmonella enterica subsp. arizonae]
MKYILYKGFIGVDGISLTVGEVTPTRFCVYLIPEDAGAYYAWAEKNWENV